jgi:hypothetical protein
MILGLTGRMGSGKDTVYQRLAEIVAMPDLVVERRAFADPLKDSVASLLMMDRNLEEELKRSVDDAVVVYRGRRPIRTFTMREFLQRYGTEAHRDVFGQDFWLDATLPLYEDNPYYRSPGTLLVITDCRFPNEAERVKECGGQVWEVVGPEGRMRADAEHASERALPAELRDGFIWNVVRDDGFKDLDDSLRQFVIPALLGGR